jgi:hypothetical protein
MGENFGRRGDIRKRGVVLRLSFFSFFLSFPPTLTNASGPKAGASRVLTFFLLFFFRAYPLGAAD